MVQRKKALITGITGQDGSYLAEFLLQQNYEVVGMIRRSSSQISQTHRLDEFGIFPKVELIYGDITDMVSIINILKKINPDEVYHLAAQSHVKISFDQPVYTTNSIAIGTLNLLEAIRIICPKAKVYLAGSSEMFGNEKDEDGYRRETTQMIPVSPYGASKLYAYNLGKIYRESYGMFISNGILFNHESPRRGLNFVSNKIVEGAVKIKKGKQDKLVLGNLNATRDWGHAKDYTKAMWMMLQHHKPDDFVCATGEQRSVKDLCNLVFSNLNLDIDKYVVSDSRYFRPYELHDLKGDCSKAVRDLGWTKTYTFNSMIEEMIEYWDKKL